MGVNEKEFIRNEVIPFLESQGHTHVSSKTSRFHDGCSGFLSGYLCNYNNSNSSNINSWVGTSYCDEFIQEIDILSIKANTLYVSEVKSILDQKHLQQAIGQIIMHRYALIYIHDIDIRYQIIFPNVGFKKLEYCNGDDFSDVFKNIMRNYSSHSCNNNRNILSNNFTEFMYKALKITFLVI